MDTPKRRVLFPICLLLMALIGVMLYMDTQELGSQKFLSIQDQLVNGGLFSSYGGKNQLMDSSGNEARFLKAKKDKDKSSMKAGGGPQVAGGSPANTGSVSSLPMTGPSGGYGPGKPSRDKTLPLPGPGAAASGGRDVGGGREAGSGRDGSGRGMSGGREGGRDGGREGGGRDGGRGGGRGRDGGRFGGGGRGDGPPGGGRGGPGGPGASSRGGSADMKGRPAGAKAAAKPIPGNDPHRVSTNPKTLVYKPKSFNIDDLPKPDPNFKFSVLAPNEKFKDVETAAMKLCGAAFQRDIGALKYMLYDLGIPATLENDVDTGKNAFHCLGQAYGNIEKVSLLQNTEHRETWLHERFGDNYLLDGSKVYSVLMRDLFEGEEANVVNTGIWLLRAGVNVNGKEDNGNTPLHIAAMGGFSTYAQFLIESGAEVNALNKDGRTPMHYACVYGHMATADFLFKAKGDMYITDKFGVTPYDLVHNPGAVSAADAQKIFQIQQRPHRKINRVLQPELKPNLPNHTGWKYGTGGWKTTRLPGYETDMQCEGIDQYYVDEIDGDTLFQKYLARNMPVLIRGALDDSWQGAANLYKPENLKKLNGKKEYAVSDVPYTQKFGNDQFTRQTLSDYIDDVLANTVKGGKYPWYIFTGNSITTQTELEDSPVKWKDCPTPDCVQFGFEQMVPDMTFGTKRGTNNAKSREHFTNAQWGIGTEGSGAPVHFHNFAWNAVVYGAKRWLLYPPHDRIMSNTQILQFVKGGDMEKFEGKNARRLDCIQTAGDILMVPESWGHGVLNLQDSVAVATEVVSALWRQVPITRTAKSLDLLRR